MRFRDLNLLFHLCVRAVITRFALGDALRNMNDETSLTGWAPLCQLRRQ